MDEKFNSAINYLIAEHTASMLKMAKEHKEEVQALSARVAELDEFLEVQTRNAARYCVQLFEAKEQIAAHERVCAGTWVPVWEMLPPERWIGVVIEEHLHHEKNQFIHRVHMDELLVRDGIAEWKQGREITHWLDVKLPTSSGKG